MEIMNKIMKSDYKAEWLLDRENNLANTNL